MNEIQRARRMRNPTYIAQVPAQAAATRRAAVPTTALAYARPCGIHVFHYPLQEGSAWGGVPGGARQRSRGSLAPSGEQQEAVSEGEGWPSDYSGVRTPPAVPPSSRGSLPPSLSSCLRCGGDAAQQEAVEVSFLLFQHLSTGT